MKYSVSILAVLLFGISPLVAQTTTKLPPGWVDGSKTPNLIPDRIAYRLVFMSLMLPASPDQTAINRQETRLKQIGFSATDETVLKQTLTMFASSYSTLKQTNGEAAQTWALVQATRSSLQTQLSADGNSKFSAYVALEKQRMIANPSN